MKNTEEQLELEFLTKKMREAIIYQGYFGKDGDTKLDRQAENCAKISIQFTNKKIKNLSDKQ